MGRYVTSPEAPASTSAGLHSSWTVVSSYFLHREVLLSTGFLHFSIHLLLKKTRRQNIKSFPEAARNLPVQKKKA
jgi:hypothetical protein